MKIDFANDPAYILEFEAKTAAGLVPIYTLKDISSFHTSRYAAGGAQKIYSSCGITPELQKKILKAALEEVNKNNLANVSVWLNNLLYRTQYPIDEDCLLRMAAIYSFIDGENPNQVLNHWTEKKTDIFKEDPAAFDFFFQKGLVNTPEYNEYLAGNSPISLQQRTEMLKSLIPQLIPPPPPSK